MSQQLVYDGSYAFGVVENISDDPDMTNWVQVRLFALHEQDPAILPTENLPWCPVLLPNTVNDATSHGLEVNMVVKCSFLDGVERQQPVVEAVLPGKVATGNSTTGNTDKTISKYADGRSITPKTKLDDTQPADPYKAKYPFNRVIETKAGHRIEIDDTPDGERLHFFHKSGTNTEYHPDGSMVTAITKDEFVVVNGKSTHVIKGDQVTTIKGKNDIKVTGDVTLETDGSLNAKAAKDVKVEAGGKIDAKAGGDITFDSGGNVTNKCSGNYTVEAGGQVSIKAGATAAIEAGGVASLNGATVQIG